MPSFGKKASSKPTRLFYATDLHGSERTYRKFLNAGKFYEAQVLIMGGDIIGKVAVPIIQESAGRYRATLQGSTESIESEEALKALLDRIGMLGWYAKVMTEEEFREISADRARVDALFHQLARQRLESWIELSETRLGGTGIKCYVTGGNDDYPDVLEVMKTSGAQTFIDCEGVVVPLDEQHTMISVGNSTLTPWKTPREVTDEELGRIIDGMIAKVTDMTNCVFNFHDPPKDSTLDTCPELDWNTDPPAPIVKAGQLVMHGAGSASVRKAIETHQPVLGLHGHIHESAGAAHLGRTLCVNPGSEYGEGRLRGVLVNLAGGKVDGYQMTSG
ncbi:MAG: metallophosphoesterase [Chloroflexi bacterium]|nr:metallophosphoesterase [Chloroflexota bacterium]